jgi:hypothetical protein
MTTTFPTCYPYNIARGNVEARAKMLLAAIEQPPEKAHDHHVAWRCIKR